MREAGNNSGYWDFGAEKEPKVHRIHAYPAKFPSFITSKAVRRAKKQGIQVGVVADIFCGCGTTAFESRRIGLSFWGCDINPVAALIARVKSAKYSAERLDNTFSKIEIAYKNRLSDDGTDFLANERIKYWFHDDDIKKLACLLKIIDEQVLAGKYRDFFRCAFSNILKPVSKWLRKSIKPQMDSHKKRVDVWDAFKKQVTFMIKAEKEIGALPSSHVNIRNVNFLKVKLRRPLADIIVTSPPYVTSYEYADLHQLSTLWLGYTDDYRSLRHGTIGSIYEIVDDDYTEKGLNRVGEKIVNSLKDVAKEKAKATIRYFLDMRQAIKRCKRLLRPGGMVFFVIGDTEYKGTKVANSLYLAQCLKDEGFISVRREKRKITGKNLSPYRTTSGKFSADSTCRKIYAEEYVLSGRLLCKENNL